MFDISNPLKPLKVGDYAGHARSIAVADRYAYVLEPQWGDFDTTHESALRVISIADPTNPALVGSYTPGGWWAMAMADTYAYVLGGGVLEVIAISNVASPHLVGVLEVAGGHLAVMGNHAYLTSLDSGDAIHFEGLLRVIDVSDPSQPVQVGSAELGAHAGAVAASGDYVYIVAAGLQVFDISEPTRPQRVAHYREDDPRWAGGIAVSGDRLYVMRPLGFEIYRITEIPTTHYVWMDSPNPTPPYDTWETAAHVIQDAVDVAEAGSTVLVTNGVYAVGERTTTNEARTVSANRVVLASAIRLESVNGPGVAMIDGGGEVRCVYLGTNASLSGFTITNGYVDGKEGYCTGGGVWCASSTAVLTNCLLKGNHVWGNAEAGGVYGGTLYDCTLEGNGAQAVGGGAAGSTLYHCTLTGNDADSGGAAFACTLYDCTVTANSAF